MANDEPAYPDENCKWNPAPHPVFIDGVTAALTAAIKQDPIRFGQDWSASFPCPYCGWNSLIVRVIWTPLLETPEAPIPKTIEVVCDCRHPHEGRDNQDYPTGCGQMYGFEVDVLP